MLLESVLHKLLDRKVWSADDLLQAVETAVSAKCQMSADGEHAEVASVAAGALRVVANSLSVPT